MRADLTFHVPDCWIDEPIRVIVAGAGGTGSEVIDALAALHRAIVELGHPFGFDVTVYDGSTVSTANTLRQRFWPGDEGKNKAALLIERQNLFRGLRWSAVPQHLDESVLAHSEFDLLITCTDSPQTRWKLASFADRRFMHGRREPPPLWLDFGNLQTSGQWVIGHFAKWKTAKDAVDYQPLPNVCDLYPVIKTMRDDPSRSCSAEETFKQSFLVNRFASMGVRVLWDLLRSGSVQHHGAMFDLSRQLMNPIPIRHDIWAGFGLTVPRKLKNRLNLTLNARAR